MTKLRAEDKEWLQAEIGGQLEKALKTVIDKFEPHGWRRVTRFVREWGIAGALITGTLALLAFAAGALYQATARVGKEATFETNTQRDLVDMRRDIT